MLPDNFEPILSVKPNGNVLIGEVEIAGAEAAKIFIDASMLSIEKLGCHEMLTEVIVALMNAKRKLQEWNSL